MKKFVFWATLAGLSGAMVSHAVAEKLIITSDTPPTHQHTTAGFEPFMQCLTEATDGYFEFDYYPGAALHTGPNSVDAINSGLTNITNIPIGQVSNVLPLAGISMLPYMGADPVEMTAAFRSVLTEGGPIAEEFTSNGMRPILINMSPVYQVMSRNGPIETAADFKGKVVRSGGGSMNLVINSLGSSPSEMPGSDMYIAMQRGAIDATIMSTMSIAPYNMQEVMKAVSSNAQFGSFATAFVVSQSFYDGLSPEHQKVIDDCGQKIELEYAQAVVDSNAQVLKDMEAQGLTVFEFSEDESAKLAELLAPVVDEYISRLDSRGLPGREVYDNYKSHLPK